MIEKLFKILSSSKAKTKRRRYPQKDDGFFKEFLLIMYIVSSFKCTCIDRTSHLEMKSSRETLSYPLT